MVVIVFFVPIAFFYVAFRTNLLYGPMDTQFSQQTPFLRSAFRVMAVIWLLGAGWKVIKYVQCGSVIRGIIRHSMRAEKIIQSAADVVCGDMKLSKKVPVYMTVGQRTPMIVGFWHKKILLPQKQYESDELYAILEHELWHYRQGDLLLKKACSWIARIQWFNPVTRYLQKEVDKWGDIYCDKHVCFEGSTGWDIKRYFEIVARNSGKVETELMSGMRLHKTLESLKGRVNRMMKYNPKNELKKAWIMLLVMGFLLASTVTSLAAGRGIAALYDAVFKATKVIIEEDLQPQITDLEEVEWLPDENKIIIEMPDNPMTRATSSYTWDISAGKAKLTGEFYAANGNKVVLTVSPDPANAKVGAGLSQPDGYWRGVSGTGAYSHTFTVNQNGYHRVYVENLAGKDITVGLIVVR
ncbi:M56 family metallopeptidase [Lacrimispora sp. NSJ-141]|uniref:M56 family metallopeptidase n=1 Tax=Lientehia hominis TaxID=2897778 RepID=A0AAP2W8M9_9FIRM|nr:M56 family metallopeptidase [Lientehia hominis]